jgi:hypothetical protein
MQTRTAHYHTAATAFGRPSAFRGPGFSESFMFAGYESGNLMCHMN